MTRDIVCTGSSLRLHAAATVLPPLYADIRFQCEKMEAVHANGAVRASGSVVDDDQPCYQKNGAAHLPLQRRIRANASPTVGVFRGLIRFLGAVYSNAKRTHSGQASGTDEKTNSKHEPPPPLLRRRLPSRWRQRQQQQQQWRH